MEDHRIIQYYQTFTSLQPLLDQKETTHIFLSAIHFGYNADDTPYIHLNDHDPHDSRFDPMWSQLEEFHGQVFLMVGGAGGAYHVLFDDYDRMFVLLCRTLQTHPRIEGIDLDIEEDVDPQDVQRLVRDLRTEFPSMKFSMAPVASTLLDPQNIHYQILKSTIGKYIHFFNVQAYGDFSVSMFRQILEHVPKPRFLNMGMMASGKSQNLDPYLCVLEHLRDLGVGGTFVWEYAYAPPDWATRVAQVLDTSSQTSPTYPTSQIYPSLQTSFSMPSSCCIL